MQVEVPTTIKLHQKQYMLEVAFPNGKHFELPCEYLRVYSPSAEVRGHGQEPRKWPRNKEKVNIVAIEPVGNYAIKLIFDDKHASGIYSWETLYDLGDNFQQYWQTYRDAIHTTPPAN